MKLVISFGDNCWKKGEKHTHMFRYQKGVLKKKKTSLSVHSNSGDQDPLSSFNCQGDSGYWKKICTRSKTQPLASYRWKTYFSVDGSSRGEGEGVVNNYITMRQWPIPQRNHISRRKAFHLPTYKSCYEKNSREPHNSPLEVLENLAPRVQGCSSMICIHVVLPI